MAAAVGVAGGLGAYHLGSRSLWGDEAFSIALAREPFAEFWRVVSTSQANMSLYYFLLRGWTVFGDGEAVVRSLSLLAGVGATGPVPRGRASVRSRSGDRRGAAARGER